MNRIRWYVLVWLAVAVMVGGYAYRDHQLRLEDRAACTKLSTELMHYVQLREKQREDFLALMMGRYGFNPPAETLRPGPEEQWANDQAARLAAAHYSEISAQERAMIAAKLDQLLQEWKEANPTVSAPAR